MEQRLQHKDVWLIAVCVCITAISLLIGTHYFYSAFPEATIDFRITRDEARDTGQSFLRHHGFDLDGYRHSGIFEYDGQAKTFLERELRLEGATEVIGDPVRLWRWSSRWVKELQKEEFRVEYTTTGDLVGFAHLIEEEEKGASLEQSSARQVAEQFLQHSLQRDLTTLEFVEAVTTQRPQRADHSFTWKLKEFDISEATYRFRVGVQGDLVGSYAEFLKVPEAWQREYRELRSANEATGLVAGTLMMFTWIAMLVVIVMNIRHENVRWKTVITFASIAFVLTLLAQLNVLPLTEYGFDTTDTYGSFLTDQLLSGLFLAFLSALSIAVLTAGAEPEYRRGFANQISLSDQFSLDGIRTKRFLLGTIIGLTLTAVFVAYQTLFYLAADKLGAWSPADIPYSAMVNTYIPWIVVLLIGFMPAVSEEFTSRAFSIPFLQRFLKWRWLAVVIPALVWGFAHANYPQQPFYIRGIEVGLVGIVLGYVVLRWGLLPALVWHYTIDALLTAMILLRSSNSYFVVSAAISVGIMLLPLMVAIALYVRHRFFIDATSLLNSEDPPSVTRADRRADSGSSPEALLSAAVLEVHYRPQTTVRLLVMAGLVAISLSIFLIDAQEPLPDFVVSVTADDAEQIARDYLETSAVDLTDYRTVVSQKQQVDGDASRYRMQRGGLAQVNRLYRLDLSPCLWQVRFFRPLQKEEYQVFVDVTDGSVYTVTHLLEEEAPGADLHEEDARQLAEQHLRHFGLDPESFELVEASSEMLVARRDHSFEFEARDGDRRNVDESRFRCVVGIAGDRAVSLRRYVKVPEEWLRQRRERTTLGTVLRWFVPILLVAICLHLFWLLIKQIRSGDIRWRGPVVIGIVGAALILTVFLNNLGTLYASYSTQQPEGVFILTRCLLGLVAMLSAGIGLTGAVGMALSLYPRCLQRIRDERWRYLQDAVWVAVIAWLAGLVINRVRLLAADHFPEHFGAAGFPIPSGLDALLPFWDGMAGALLLAYAFPFAMAVVIYYATKVIVRPSLIVTAVLILSACGAGASAQTAGEFTASFSMSLLNTGAMALILVFLLRDNILAYVLFGLFKGSLEGAYLMVTQPASLFQIHGWLLLGTILALTLGSWVLAMKKSASSESQRGVRRL